MRGWFGVGLAIAIGGASASTGALPPPEARIMMPPQAQVPAEAQPAPTTENLLVSIRRESGFCLSSECFSEVAIATDGTYRYSTHGSSPVIGRISDAELQRLQERIEQTGPDDLYAQPPTPQPIDAFCGLAFDGPEVIYTFQREGRIEQVRGCDRAIAPNHPLVQQLEQLYSRISEQATRYPSVEFDPNEPLPSSVSNRVERTFQRDYGDRLTNVQVLSSETVLWTDCLPDLPDGRFSNQPCEPSPRTGWRVTVSGEFPDIEQSITRVYYADRQAALMDRPSSLNEQERSQLAEALNLPVSELQILAMQEKMLYPASACRGEVDCPAPPLGLSWRVLVQHGYAEKILHLSSLGTTVHTHGHSSYFSEADRATLGALPVVIANAVVNDAQERLQTAELSTDSNVTDDIIFQVDSVKPVSWNVCHGGEGPTRPNMGICPDITISGWQMVMQGGLKSDPIRLVYYITETDAQNQDAFVPLPDGMQSMPKSVQTRILETVAQETGTPLSQLSLQAADAHFFDGCLGTAPETVNCRNDIRPGWDVNVTGSQSRPDEGWGVPAWTYRTNITGTDMRLISEGSWAPAPTAPPASL